MALKIVPLFYERSLNAFASEDDDPRFVASDPLGFWVVWNVLGRPLDRGRAPVSPHNRRNDPLYIFKLVEREHLILRPRRLELTRWERYVIRFPCAPTLISRSANAERKWPITVCDRYGRSCGSLDQPLV